MLFWVTAGSYAGATPAYVGSDDFSGTSMNTDAWTVAQTHGNGVFSQSGDDVLRYVVSSGTSQDQVAWAWINGTAPDPSLTPYGNDWSVQLDVSNPVIFTGVVDQYANVGLSIRDASNINDNGFSVRLDTAHTLLTGPQTTQWEADKETASGSTIESFGTSATSGAVLITWSAATHTLTAAFDEDGATDGYVWTAFSTYDPTASDAWNMTSGGSFLIALSGNSLSTDATDSTNFGDLYVDNFEVTDSAATIAFTVIPEPAHATLAGEVAVLCFAFVGVRRRVPIKRASMQT